MCGYTADVKTDIAIPICIIIIIAIIIIVIIIIINIIIFNTIIIIIRSQFWFEANDRIAESFTWRYQPHLHVIRNGSEKHCGCPSSC